MSKLSTLAAALLLPVITNAAVTEWNSSSTYEAPDTVSYEGTLYQAVRSVYQNTAPTDSWFWKDLSFSDPNNPPTWQNDITYEVGSFVTYEGEVYEALRFVYLNTAPDNEWFWKSSSDTGTNDTLPISDWSNDCSKLEFSIDASRDYAIRQGSLATTITYTTNIPDDEIVAIEWYSTKDEFIGSGDSLVMKNTEMGVGVHEFYAVAWNNYNESIVSNTLVLPVQNTMGLGIIITGYAFGDTPYFFNNIAPNGNIAYKRLRDRGYSNEQLYYMNPVTWQSIGGDPLASSNIVDESQITKENFHTYLRSIAELVQADIPLTIYLLGHGSNTSQNNSKFYINEDEYIDPATLNEWLNEFGDLSSNKNYITVIADFGYSGGFVHGLKTTNQKRVVISSADAGTPAYFSGGKAFATTIFNQVYRGRDLKTCFEDAVVWSENNALGGNRANPLMDCNGNGIPNEQFDLDIAETIYLGGSQNLQ